MKFKIVSGSLPRGIVLDDKSGEIRSVLDYYSKGGGTDPVTLARLRDGSYRMRPPLARPAKARRRHVVDSWFFIILGLVVAAAILAARVDGLI